MEKNRVPVSGIRDSIWGFDFTYIEPINVYGATFGNACFVGPFVEIQSKVKVGDNDRIQSHSFICSNVTIGNDSFIGHGVMFINDRFSDGERANGNQKKIEPTVIGARVLVGSNSTILPVTICDDVVIGAGSVVTRNVLEPGIYAGNPARKLRARPEVSK